MISGAVLNCGGPLSRAPAALASLKLGVGELGGFTGSGTKRLGPPELFPEPGATPPAPAGAAALGSFLGRGEKGGDLGKGTQNGMGVGAGAPVTGADQEGVQGEGPARGRLGAPSGGGWPAQRQGRAPSGVEWSPGGRRAPGSQEAPGDRRVPVSGNRQPCTGLWEENAPTTNGMPPRAPG